MGYELKAEEMGVRIVSGYPPRGWWGSYDPDRHRITIRPDLGYVQHRSTMWHELGHAHYRHIGCTPRQERQARMWAARHLIYPAAFVEAARITDDLISIAHRLNVMPDDVRHFEQSLTLEELLILRQQIDGSHLG
jgi:hypothetical protein